MFANHRLAFAAAEMEVHEAKARLLAQNQLAAAQAQAAQRKLVSCSLLPFLFPSGIRGDVRLLRHDALALKVAGRRSWWLTLSLPWQIVAREKASNEAKSEFMSLMCHEVRTPLNGCLASAEMLLETVLQASPDSLLRRHRAGSALCHRLPFAIGLLAFGVCGGRIAV